jgi:hypothetical protein
MVADLKAAATLSPFAPAAKPQRPAVVWVAPRGSPTALDPTLKPKLVVPVLVVQTSFEAGITGGPVSTRSENGPWVWRSPDTHTV